MFAPPKKNRYQPYFGADNGLFVYRGYCFRPLSPPEPGVVNDADDKNNKVKQI
jgi:hypothetical protein